MTRLFLLMMFFNVSIVHATCIEEHASNEQNYDNCTTAAGQGNAYAQYALANLYNAGQGTEQDSEKAVEWYKKSAQQNNDLAQYSLAVMYEFGLGGLEADHQIANKLYQRAADNGNYFALNKLDLLAPTKVNFELATPSQYHSYMQQQQDEPYAVERFLDWLFRVEKIQ